MIFKNRNTSKRKTLIQNAILGSVLLCPILLVLLNWDIGLRPEVSLLRKYINCNNFVLDKEKKVKKIIILKVQDGSYVANLEGHF